MNPSFLCRARRLDQEEGRSRHAEFHQRGHQERNPEGRRNRAATAHVTWAALFSNRYTMASKDRRPSQRLGKSNPRRMKIITWTVALIVCVGGVFAAYRYTGTTEVEVPVARVRKGDFVVACGPRRYQERAFRDPQSAAGARPAHRAPGAARPSGPQGRCGGGVRWFAAGSERDQPHHQRARRGRRDRADEGHAEDRRRSRCDEQDVERVRSGARQAGRQQGGGYLRHRRREEPHSWWVSPMGAAAGEGLDQRAPGGTRSRSGALGQRRTRPCAI
jgi:hypothetical protein